MSRLVARHPTGMPAFFWEFGRNFLAFPPEIANIPL
jgi:hypothetical protein